MNSVPKEIPMVFLDPALELEELEDKIRTALVRIWAMQGLVLMTSIGTIGYLLAQQVYR